MSNVTIKFETDNAAFVDSFEEECAQILRRIADNIERGYRIGAVVDSNGNVAGHWRATEPDDPDTSEDWE